MYRKLIIAIFIVICQQGICFGMDFKFEYTPHCNAAYKHFMALQITEGSNEVQKEILANPYNLMSVYVDDYDDFLTLLMNGDKNDYEQRKWHLEQRLKLISRGSDASPWYRLCKAGIYMHWAIAYFRLGEHVKSAFHFRKCYVLLKENQKLFPDFKYNAVFYGVVQTAVGAIPEEYKWMAELLGMKGDVKKGIATIENYIKTSSADAPLMNEAQIYYAYFTFYLMHQQEAAWSYVNGSTFSTADNLLNIFVKANIALNYRKSQPAIQILKDAQNNKYYNLYPVLDYEIGTGYYFNLDTTCIFYFQRFLNRYTGKICVKDTWQKMTLYYYVHGNLAKALYYKEQTKKHGIAQADADKQAQRFATGEGFPDKTLLQARLLSDGGNNEQALAVLNTYKETNTTPIKYKLEYCYRLARVYDQMNNPAKALQQYQSAINMGNTLPEQFAARAALQMGFIFEQQGQIKQAITKYDECLKMRHHDFQASIDEQAKAGINRLAGR